MKWQSIIDVESPFGGLAVFHQIEQIILIKNFIYCFELHKMLQNLPANTLIDQFSEELL